MRREPPRDFSRKPSGNRGVRESLSCRSCMGGKPAHTAPLTETHAPGILRALA
ncbi:hypothetical protein [Chamaesiphon sp. VAR_69_metabat_338]|uniref:hypothetical protein n=1 Tax=Chamaesiphon sp. VAR_69_metabat_338 TaxID=2964704 RepID=UPI00286DB2B7|nr:hypothetical protein [Chamaesiphon sp. VAR_69_metabat_338]